MTSFMRHYGVCGKMLVIMRFSVSGNNEIHSIAVKIQLGEMCLYARYLLSSIQVTLFTSETPLVMQTTYNDILPCDKCNSTLVWCNVCPIQLTLALWQLSRPLPSRFTGSALTALQLIALITCVSHLGPKVLARELSLSIGGGAWITAGHNCRRGGGRCTEDKAC